MTSLARREGLAGKVQMIYIDPPYGIKFSSNWQNEVGKRDVKDKNEDLTREPEMIKAYRDTWTLGVHSYLDYLKQRLIVAAANCSPIPAPSSSRSPMKTYTASERSWMKCFGHENFAAQSPSQKTGVCRKPVDRTINDYVVWYAKKIPDVPQLYQDEKSVKIVAIIR